MANNAPGKPVCVHTQVSVFTEVGNGTKGSDLAYEFTCNFISDSTSYSTDLTMSQENRLKRRLATVPEAIPCRRTPIQVSYDLDLFL
jgi:hypothetical protein